MTSISKAKSPSSQMPKPLAAHSLAKNMASQAAETPPQELPQCYDLPQSFPRVIYIQVYVCHLYIGGIFFVFWSNGCISVYSHTPSES